MVGEIVFHLGDCKTGTTSIQRTLAAGKVRSPNRSVIYPAQANHIPLASTLNRTQEAKYADKRFAELAQKLKKSRADTAIVSAETFEFVDPRKLEEMIERHLSPWQGKMRFISYVRPHADRLVSGYAERTKQGWHIGSMDSLFERFADQGFLHFAPRLRKWRETFGEAHTVRPMVRSMLRDGDVVSDFLDFVFEGQDYDFDPVPQANESLTLSDLAALRKIHGVLHEAAGSGPKARNARKTFGWNLAILLSALPRPENAQKPRLHVDLAHRVVETYRDDAAIVDREFFGLDATSGPLSLALKAAPERAVDVAQPIAPEDYFDAAALRLLQGQAKMLARMIKSNPEAMIRGMRPEALQGSKSKGKVAKKGKGTKSDQARNRAARPVVENSAIRLARHLPEGLRRKLSPLRRHLP
ncbi:hypothetical protein LOS8367_03432 [Limimaricola soesokkakensis]|uniref:Sulfotransferase family protein n=1 Tax=Limimaricola soesokkakensis TaxID=1343159 RepID=A0A1X7A2P6_9RHOB|nr:hypothetical protein [Limimaricola soesokkakensis]SLN68566.1 hypothetical protein LOS8367_03432 [Limimaricola soesokkakensis]